MIRPLAIRAIAYGIAAAALLSLLIQLAADAAPAVAPSPTHELLDRGMAFLLAMSALGVGGVFGLIFGYHLGWRHGWDESDKVHEALRNARGAWTDDDFQRDDEERSR